MPAPEHRSFSQMSTFFLCPERYRRQYIEGERRPIGVAAVRGRAYHKGAETNFKQKIITHVDISLSDIVDSAVAGLDGVASGRDEMALTPEEQQVGKAKTISNLTGEVVEMAELFAREQAPRHQPVGVEEDFRITMKGDYPDIVGRLDIREDGAVWDFKSSGRKMRQDEADASIQLTTYEIAFTGIAGEKPKRIGYDRAILTKTKCYSQIVESERTPDHVRALAHRVSQMERCIEAGLFLPCDPNAWQCSPKWCPYWRDCPYVAGERALYQLET